MTHIDKYLRGYAEPEAGGLSGDFKTYRDSLVIPAHAEPAGQVERVWEKLPNPEQLLIIIVANASHHDPETLAMVDAMTSARAATNAAKHAKLLTAPGSPDILLVDRYADGRQVPAKQGVGLARKVGCDIAVALHQAGIITSQWLRTTDADVILPPDYLQAFSGDEVARLYPFEHRAAPEAAPSELLGLQLYEIYLLYTVLGLRSAGSPYAYPTIGSIIACRADAYAAVRGFPRRASGEDFYLLNKLRKIGTVSLVNGDSIQISGRLSERVPVGTGQAVRRIAANPAPLKDYTFEHPECYAKLGALLQYLDEIAASQPDTMNHPDSLIQSVVATAGLAAHYKRERERGLSTPVMRKSLHDWFDGLRTRQFIRKLSAATGRIPLSALARSDLLGSRDPSPAAVLAHLRQHIFSSPDLDQSQQPQQPGRSAAGEDKW